MVRSFPDFVGATEKLICCVLEEMAQLVIVAVLFLAAGVSSEMASFTTPGGYNFTVPSGVTQITVRALGAQGGQGDGSPGGFGGEVNATLMVTPGETLGVFVGGL